MDLREKLSPHFTLGEMVRTSHRHIDNTPSVDVVDRLRALCVDFLEPVRDRFGPLWITSGYRSQNLNGSIGGSKVSAHMYGCAADFVPLYSHSTAEIVEWIVESKLFFDQVIDEYSSTSNWIHLGMVRPVGIQTPRRQALTMRKGKYTTFVPDV